MNVQPGDILEGFRVEACDRLPELDAQTFQMRHITSGARLLFIENDDEEMAFSISFKTPPKDDTGVFHILEHSVLCGSQRFPVKEPFVNLLKSSMQTFLNAMTFPDKTMYPVATTNHKDLLNLMDVYLDAVLHPRIYEKREIFEQEGWHLELANTNDKLQFNGVVYNEMKGALSDPEGVLYNVLNAALFPQSAYRFESGGDPKAIPSLTYEAFLEAHARHYSLDNSYIFLYGSLDIQAVLHFLDSRYLGISSSRVSEYATQGPHPLELQQPVSAGYITHRMITSPENACVGLGYVVGTFKDHEKILATGILLDALMGSNVSPLKKALLESKLGGDVAYHFDDSRLQPLLMIELKNAQPDAVKPFKQLLESSCQKLINEGIDSHLLRASLTHNEFLLREADYGTAKGVVYAMNTLSSWLYDDNMALNALRWQDTFTKLVQELDSGYFEQLLEEIILQNKHSAYVELIPCEAPEQTDEERALAVIEEKLSAEDREKIVEACAALREAQELPDSPEAKAKLPLLSLSDINSLKSDPDYDISEVNGRTCLYHPFKTHGISYLSFYYPLEQIAFEELPYASILASLMGKLDTQQHSAEELDVLNQQIFGRLRFSLTNFETYQENTLLPRFMIDASCLEGNSTQALALIHEILTQTSFNDFERIHEILQQRKIALEQHFAQAGHAAANMRVQATWNKAGVLSEQIWGVDFYLQLKGILEHFNERKTELSDIFTELAARIFSGTTLVSLTGSEQVREAFENSALTRIDPAQFSQVLTIPQPIARDEAFIVPSEVCFLAAGQERRGCDEKYNGTWNVVNRLLSFDYLWNEVRVKGGAYGCGFSSTRRGALSFYSYRDPNLDATIKRFDEAGDWLAHYEPTEEELRGYIISSVASLDAPVTPRIRAHRQDTQYICKLPEDWRNKIRDDILGVTTKKLNDASSVLNGLGKRRSICVFGNEEIIRSSERELSITKLY